jgi:hypothetical protein
VLFSNDHDDDLPSENENASFCDDEAANNPDHLVANNLDDEANNHGVVVSIDDEANNDDGHGHANTDDDHDDDDQFDHGIHQA